jgi:hypothetical protein
MTHEKRETMPAWLVQGLWDHYQQPPDSDEVPDDFDSRAYLQQVLERTTPLQRDFAGVCGLDNTDERVGTYDHWFECWGTAEYRATDGLAEACYPEAFFTDVPCVVGEYDWGVFQLYLFFEIRWGVSAVSSRPGELVRLYLYPGPGKRDVNLREREG